MSDVTIQYDVTTCPSPADILAGIDTQVTNALNALNGFVCDKDGESIQRHNDLVTALNALKANTATALDEVSAVISTNAEGIAAARLFVEENQTAIEALVAGVAANQAATQTNQALAAANEQLITSLNGAISGINTGLTTLQGTVEALEARVDGIDTRVTDAEAAIAALQAAEPPVTDLAPVNARIDDVDAKVDATVCAVLTGMKAAADGILSAHNAVACDHGITPLAIADMSLGSFASQAPSEPPLVG